MKRFSQQVAVVAAATLAATALTLSGGTASADHADCNRQHDMGQSTSGTLGPTNLIDTWVNFATTTTRTFTMTPTGGDADLVVYDGSCVFILCTSSNAGSATETCTVNNFTGPLHPSVEFVSGTPNVSYTLTSSAPSTTSSLPVVQTDTYPSDDCDGVDFASGYAGNVYLTARAERVGDETWVCFRGDATTARQGGKLVITDPAAPSTPGADGDSGSCATAPGNTVPGTHPVAPIVVGTPTDPYYTTGFVDLYRSDTETWLCLNLQSDNLRVVIPTDGSLPGATLYLDKGAPRPAVQMPPGAPVSGFCQAQEFHTRVADVTTLNTRAYVYVHRAGGDTRLCVRAAGYGGVLKIANPSVTAPTVTTTGTTCPGNLYTNGFFQIATGGTSGGTGTVCLRVGTQVVRVDVVAPLNAPTSISWDPDAGTPDF